MARNNRSESTATIVGQPVMQGYLLKKKRKRMQGLARRWFTLSSTGALSYSFHPNGPIRDSVLVNLAFVHASRKEKAFHIDSGNTVMHCKALTTADFDKWTVALRGFIGGTVQERSGGRVSSIGGPATEANHAIAFDSALEAVAGLAISIREIESIHAELKSADANLRTSPHLHSTSPSQKINKFLKKGSIKDLPRIEDYFESKSSAPDDHSQSIRQLGIAISSLKAQQALITSLLHNAATSRVGSPLNVAGDNNKFGSSGSSTRGYASRNPFPVSGSRASSISLATSEDTTDDFYEDAGMGEFFLEEEGDDVSSDDEASTKQDQEAQSEVDEAEREAEEYLAAEEDNSLEAITEDKVVETSGPTVFQVARRVQLPKPVSGDEFSMLSMLRKNVGKDLSTISFPVTFNEPLSALQRIAEELEYPELLHKAATTQDPVERLILVATFAVSGSSGNKFRSSRKPFNPLLGETFECLRPDKGFKFVSEKVSHHPPVMAFHASATTSPTSIDAAWSINGHIAPSQKFWGRSFELMFPGNFSVTFKDTGETFSVVKPSSFVRNLVAGTKYLEIVGEMIVSSLSSPAKAVINFKEGSSWGGSSSRNKIEGTVFDRDGRSAVELVGRWDESIDRKVGATGFERLWSIKEFQKNPEKYYGFSQFAIQLNEITSLERDWLPTSDSRLRPDQTALELGKVDEAEETKIRVEEKQREKRKIENEQGGHVPEHFRSTGEGWTFTGDYFTKRAARKLKDIDIF